MQRTETYQDVFLNQARRERTPLTVFLVNGFQMRGVITGFDPFVIVLFSEVTGRRIRREQPVVWLFCAWISPPCICTIRLHK